MLLLLSALLPWSVWNWFSTTDFIQFSNFWSFLSTSMLSWKEWINIIIRSGRLPRLERPGKYHRQLYHGCREMEKYMVRHLCLAIHYLPFFKNHLLSFDNCQLTREIVIKDFGIEFNQEFNAGHHVNVTSNRHLKLLGFMYRITYDLNKINIPSWVHRNKYFCIILNYPIGHGFSVEELVTISFHLTNVLATRHI